MNPKRGIRVSLQTLFLVLTLLAVPLFGGKILASDCGGSGASECWVEGYINGQGQWDCDYEEDCFDPGNPTECCCICEN